MERTGTGFRGAKHVVVDGWALGAEGVSGYLFDVRQVGRGESV